MGINDNYLVANLSTCYDLMFPISNKFTKKVIYGPLRSVIQSLITVIELILFTRLKETIVMITQLLTCTRNVNKKYKVNYCDYMYLLIYNQLTMLLKS